MSQLRISCLIYSSRHAFAINIEPKARLYNLQELVWTKENNSFSGLESKHLTLWKVPFGDDDSLDNIQLVDAQGGVTKLTANVRRVGRVISSEEVETHMIVIQTPPKLRCWVRGLPKSATFDLQLLPEHKVFDLRKAIKKAMEPLFDDIPAIAIVLWKVELDKFQTEDFLQDDIACGRLLGDEVVQSILPESVARDCVIIVSRSLSQSESASLKSGPQGLVDLVEKRFEISRERKAKHHGPPSTLGEPANFSQIQRSDKTYFGCARPLARELQFPLALIHPIFGTFIDDCSEISLGARDNKFAQRFRKDMCEFYSDEGGRRNALCALLNEFDFKVTAAHIGGLQERTDGHSTAGKDHPIYIHELKNELSSGTAEPSFQALLYFQSFIDQFQLAKDTSTYHPCFIACVLGPYMVFGGAVLTDRVNLEIFSSVPLNFHTDNHKAFDSLARHLAALTKAVKSLEKYYEKLDQKTLQPTDIPQPCFPYPTSFHHLPDNSRVSSLTYKHNLAGRRLVFKGSIDGGKKPVCIKFVRSYGVEVHRWYAKRGMAPELFGFQGLPGGWYLVVMEFLEKPWELLWEEKRYVTFSPSEELQKQLRDALVEMHQNHMVHGDIRDTNIMVDTASNQFRLLDFDWAGKVEEVKYPKFVNTQPELRRPEDVEDGKVILPGHDMAMVGSIFETA